MHLIVPPSARIDMLAGDKGGCAAIQGIDRPGGATGGTARSRMAMPTRCNSGTYQSAGEVRRDCSVLSFEEGRGQRAGEGMLGRAVDGYGAERWRGEGRAPKRMREEWVNE